MAALHDALHALTNYLCGCMHKSCLPICPYKVAPVAYGRREPTKQGFDCGFLPVRQHPPNAGLCLHTPSDDGPKIPGTCFYRYRVETQHRYSGHLCPMDRSLTITLN